MVGHAYFNEFAVLGRLAIRDMGRTVAVGIVKDIVAAPKEEAAQ